MMEFLSISGARAAGVVWLADVAIEGTILLALAGGMAAAMRRCAAAARHRVWAAALAGLVVVAVLAALPGWRVVPSMSTAVPQRVPVIL